MIASDVVRAVIMLCIPVGVAVDAIGLIYALAIAESAASRFFFPARTALLPALVARDRLAQANAAMGFSLAVARLGGPAVGGLALAQWGLGGAAVANGVSYLGSAAAIALVRVPGALASTSAGPRSVRGLGGDLRAGLCVALGRPTLRTLFAAMALLAFGAGLISVALVIFVRTAWSGGAAELGWLLSAQGAGALLGGPVVIVLARYLSPRLQLVLGAVGAGMLFLAVVHQSSIPVALGLMVLAGLLTVSMEVGGQTLLQLGSDDQNRGRVSALLSTLMAAASLAAVAVAGVLGGWVSPRLLLDLAGAVFILAGMLMLFSGSAPLSTADTARSPGS